jgi:hypothetical protein
MDESPKVTGVRIADADREQVAERLRTAAAEGRLTLAEADERQAAAYAALTADDLRPLVADLPRPVVAPEHTLTPDARRRLTAHAVVAGIIAVLLIAGSIVSEVLFDSDFGPDGVPMGPLFLLALSVFVHLRIARRRSAETRRAEAVTAW